jgi:hypothetical protein
MEQEVLDREAKKLLSPKYTMSKDWNRPDSQPVFSKIVPVLLILACIVAFGLTFIINGQAGGKLATFNKWRLQSQNTESYQDEDATRMEVKVKDDADKITSTIWLVNADGEEKVWRSVPRVDQEFTPIYRNGKLLMLSSNNNQSELLVYTLDSEQSLGEGKLVTYSWTRTGQYLGLVFANHNQQELLIINSSFTVLKSFPVSELLTGNESGASPIEKVLWDDSDPILWIKLNKEKGLGEFIALDIENDYAIKNFEIPNMADDWKLNTGNRTIVFSRWQENLQTYQLMLFNLAAQQEEEVLSGSRSLYKPVWVDSKTIEYTDDATNGRSEYKLKN